MRFGENNSPFSKMELIPLKDESYYNDLKISGKAVAICLRTFSDMVKEKTPSLNLLDIEKECVRIIEDHKCTPTFFKYKGFPGAVCLSVNKALVHGIPKDYVLKEGDVVTLDLGATTEGGVIADAAVSVIYGEPKVPQHPKLLKYCKESLERGISAMKVGEQLGVIGNTISRHAKSSGFKLITHYGGHGIDVNKPHAQPFVENKAKRDEGIRIEPGLTIAIEPMLAIGSDKTKVLSDKWTVVTRDIGCHFEHSIFMKEDGPEIMTDWENL